MNVGWSKQCTPGCRSPDGSGPEKNTGFSRLISTNSKFQADGCPYSIVYEHVPTLLYFITPIGQRPQTYLRLKARAFTQLVSRSNHTIMFHVMFFKNWVLFCMQVRVLLLFLLFCLASRNEGTLQSHLGRLYHDYQVFQVSIFYSILILQCRHQCLVVWLTSTFLTSCSEVHFSKTEMFSLILQRSSAICRS